MSNNLNTAFTLPLLADYFTMTSAWPGRRALMEKDVNELDRLLAKFPRKNFLNNISVTFFLNEFEGEKDLPVLDWLHKNFNEMINDDCLKAIFIRMAAKGESGIPVLKWMLDNVRDKVKSFNSVGHTFSCVHRYPDSLAIMKFLLDNAREMISFDDLKLGCNLTLSSSDTNKLQILKLIWDKTPKYERSAFADFSNKIFSQITNKDAAPLMNFLLERLLQLQGTPLYVSPKTFVELTPQFKADIDPHLKDNGYEWDILQCPPSGESFSVSFKPILEKVGPQGLLFFERVCKEMPDKLSTYSLRWAFLKGAVNGEKGKPLMASLMERSAEKLSHLTFTRGAQLADKHHHSDTAKWIKKQMRSTSPNVDEDDIKLLLATSENPSGYGPLGDAPDRFKWKPLSQEELDGMSPDSLVDMTMDGPFESGNIVRDTMRNLSFKQIHRSEAILFRGLYLRILGGHTPLKIEGDEVFKKRVHALIRKVMAVPSGRWALLFACRTKNPFHVKTATSKYNEYDDNKRTIFLNFAGKLHYFYRNHPMGEIYSDSADFDSIFVHELQHLLHHSAHPELTKALQSMPPLVEDYHNLEEQFTIAGIEKEIDPLGAFALSENTYNFETGRPERFGHKGIYRENLETPEVLERNY